jgi:ABC-type spermidine/putrescine transport system permease subunit I
LTPKARRHGLGLVPALCLVTTLILVPVFMMLWDSLQPNNLVSFKGIGFGNYLYLGSRAYYLSLGLATLRIALVSAAIGVSVGYLTAMALTKIPPAKANVLLIVITLPILSGPLVVVLGWMLLLADSGPINAIVSALGFPAIRFLGSEMGVVIGITQFILPFTIVTLYGAISAVPQSLVEAACSLGATRWKVFLRIVAPPTVPGV